MVPRASGDTSSPLWPKRRCSTESDLTVTQGVRTGAVPKAGADRLNYVEASVLGVVEGLTEFLPVSSTGHLTVTEQLFHLKVDDKSITAFTAVIQFGAIIAVLIYFRRDIWRLIVAGWLAIRDPSTRS